MKWIQFHNVLSEKNQHFWIWNSYKSLSFEEKPTHFFNSACQTRLIIIRCLLSLFILFSSYFSLSLYFPFHFCSKQTTDLFADKITPSWGHYPVYVWRFWLGAVNSITRLNSCIVAPCVWQVSIEKFFRTIVQWLIVLHSKLYIMMPE